MNRLVAVLQPESRYPRRAWLFVALALFVICLGYFVVRGPLRAAQESVAFPTFYSASRAWLLGQNPYRDDQLQEIFAGARESEGHVRFSLNPPTTFVLLAPLVVFPYSAAKWTFLALNLLFVGLGLFQLSRAAGLGWTEPRTHGFLISSLALASFHTSISQGQLTIAVMLCLVYAMRFDIERKDVPAGVMLALAGALKPQMVLVFGFYYLLQRRWRIIAATLVVGGALVAVSVARMEAAGVSWWGPLWENMAAFTRPGAHGDPTPSGPTRHLMTNLHVVLHELIESRAAVNLVVLGFAAGVLVVLRRTLQHGTRKEVLLAYSCMAVLAPLTVYSRIYTATLLIFPLAWALVSITPRFVWFSVASLLCIAPFVVPGTAILRVWARAAPSDVVTSWWWNHLLLPHQIYALLGLALCLVAAAVASGAPKSFPRLPARKAIPE